TTTRVRTIQTHNKEIDSAQPGSRVALNLPDLQHDQINRGDIVTLPTLGSANKIVDVWLQRSPRASMRSLKNGTIVKLHHATTAVAARVRFDAKTVEAGERSIARLVLDEPIFAFVGDRFVLRDWSEQHTLAGGIVLEMNIKPRRFNDPSQQKFLESRSQNLDDVATFVLSQLLRDGWADRSSLLLQSRFSNAEIDRAVAETIENKQAIATGNILAERNWWADLERAAAEAIDSHHKRFPEQSGLPLVDLRNALQKRIPRDDIFESLVVEISKNGFARSGTVLRRASHHPALPPRLQAAGEQLRKILAQHPFDPPSRKELVSNDLSQQALKFLVLSGEVVELSPIVVLGAAAYEQAIEQIRAHLKTHRQATVSELKELLKSSRRIMVPLLERLDRDGITRREGELRVLR
ncbi:MAG TPA: SelB C-terminal domain-containing protein, partial [Tepidisphaeraceae bacterium]|nr:SelB C-terminal domain-containing protein [Tepidisphaeraceae bacterium]